MQIAKKRNDRKKWWVVWNSFSNLMISIRYCLEHESKCLNQLWWNEGSNIVSAASVISMTRIPRYYHKLQQLAIHSERGFKKRALRIKVLVGPCILQENGTRFNGANTQSAPISVPFSSCMHGFARKRPSTKIRFTEKFDNRKKLLTQLVFVNYSHSQLEGVHDCL